jgi:hypothetical protein
MRTTRDPNSPWGHRLWFADHEFDEIMDEARLRARSSLITEGAGVDLDALLERVYQVVPDYVDLPDEVLGKTLFHPDGRCQVFIRRELADAGEFDHGARHRLRSTLAHECAHIIIHGHLHLVDLATPSLFGDPPPETPKVLCRMGVVGSFRGYDGKWWEYQANRGMASLEKRQVATLSEALGIGVGQEIIRDLRRTFDVSMDVTVYRLQELGSLPTNPDQAELEMKP